MQNITQQHNPINIKHGICDSSEDSDNSHIIAKEYYENGVYAGYIYYYPKAQGLGQIFSLKVESAFRNKGYAQKLITYACDDLRKNGCTHVDFNLGIHNAPAKNLLLKLGFKHDKMLASKVVNFRKQLNSSAYLIDYKYPIIISLALIIGAGTYQYCSNKKGLV